MKRRRLLSATLAALPLATCTRMTRSSAPFTTLADLATMLSTQETTPLLLVEHFLGRIAQIDRSGLRLSAVMELNPEVKRIAAASPSGPLHGLPL